MLNPGLANETLAPERGNILQDCMQDLVHWSTSLFCACKIMQDLAHEREVDVCACVWRKQLGNKFHQLVSY